MFLTKNECIHEISYCFRYCCFFFLLCLHLFLQFSRVDTATNPIVKLRAICINIKDIWEDNYIIIPVIPARNQRVETPVKTIFSREIVNILRGNRSNPENSGVTLGTVCQRDRALSLIAATLAARLARSLVGSQLSITNKAFVGVVRRAPVI